MKSRVSSLVAGAFALLLSLGPSVASAETYWAFHPRPRKDMREMDPDRPDFTESPKTVDSGHLQWEADVVRVTLEKQDGKPSEIWEAAASIFKWGISSLIDLQLVLEPVHLRREQGRTTERGWGEGGVRIKFNMWGNDDGPTALALVPYFRVGQGETRLGVLAPFAIELPLDLKLGLQVGVQRLTERSDSAAEFIQSGSLNSKLLGDLGAFVEVAAIHTLSSRDPVQFSTNAGLTYEVTDDVRLDGGTRFGVTGDPVVREFFLGIAARR